MQHALTSWSQLSNDAKYDKYQNTPPCYKQNNNEINTSSTVHSLRAFWNMKSRKRDQQRERFLQRPATNLKAFHPIAVETFVANCGT